MNKEKFNALNEESQIEYINIELSKNNSSITSVCKSLGIGRSTIRDRFKKVGYEYDKDIKQYVYNGLLEVATTQDITGDTQVLSDEITDVVQCNTDTVNEVIAATDTDIKNNLLDLANNYIDIMKMLEDYRRNTSVIKKQIVIDIPDDESKLTTIRVNKKVLDMFNEFAEANKQYKKVDLLSQALFDFINAHR